MKQKDEDEMRGDLLTAARFLVEEGFSLDDEEAVRISLNLAYLAGAIVVEDR